MLGLLACIASPENTKLASPVARVYNCAHHIQTICRLRSFGRTSMLAWPSCRRPCRKKPVRISSLETLLLQTPLRPKGVNLRSLARKRYSIPNTTKKGPANFHFRCLHGCRYWLQEGLLGAEVQQLSSHAESGHAGVVGRAWRR